jgi:DNA-binding CsgD family transcriptional regulator/PAS domain-containing protein
MDRDKPGGVIAHFLETATADLWPHGFGELAEVSGVMLSAIERELPRGLSPRNETAPMKKLTAQLRAAGEVALRLGIDSTRRLADAFGAAGHAVALIGRDGRVVHANTRFTRCAGDGINIEAGRLGSWKVEVDRALAAAIERALRHDGTVRHPLAPVVLPRRSGRRPLIAHITPLAGRAPEALRHVVAIVTLTDLEAAGGVPSEAMLQQAFNLTPAEARLAAQIAAGRSLPEIARADGTSHETLRSQLKAVFAKTGTARQAELAVLLAKFARLAP